MNASSAATPQSSPHQASGAAAATDSNSAAAAPVAVRTRFAPSPTGFIHLGNIRSALYPWAFARKTQGVFILRIEDTDVERSSEAAVQTILDGMAWLGLDIDEGPFYQTQRMPRYREAIGQMLDAGLAYRCYMPQEELDALREAQRARGEKPRYDGRWRPEPGKVLPAPPAGVAPVIRFRNPLAGSVAWDDAVKGHIEISNDELDDLVIARADGTPTYNFCVVIDDADMRITHVIRGDDHVNNTPRQINILRALGHTQPVYAHLPTVLDPSGEKMSKRNGAMSVMAYRDAGYLPEAVLNYLARLGWAHGDAEIFTREQFVAWFDLDHLGKSPAQYDPEKLKWLNGQYIKQADNARLAELVRPLLHGVLAGVATAAVDADANEAAGEGAATAAPAAAAPSAAPRDTAPAASSDTDAAIDKLIDDGPDLERVVGLTKDRASTLLELAQAAAFFYRAPVPDPAEWSRHLTDAVRPALSAMRDALASIDWTREAIAAALKATLTAHTLKMPMLAMPLRLLVAGTTHTPSIDAVIELYGREHVLRQMNRWLSSAQ